MMAMESRGGSQTLFDFSVEGRAGYQRGSTVTTMCTDKTEDEVVAQPMNYISGTFNKWK